MEKLILYFTVAVLAIFGLTTLFLSSSVILDLFGIREMEGNYVLFVVWANFISSIFYLFSAYGFIKNRRWTFKLLVISTIILLTATAGLFLHINLGGVYETKTVSGMIFRIIVTIAFTVGAFFITKQAKDREA
ncbi:MAG TPA: hypothetical protein VJ855_03930 [Marinilabiliaceae bacterium]|nr:hypothetical protein [Marinilabiliaceae bacterium]